MRKQICRFAGITIAILLTALAFAGCNSPLMDLPEVPSGREQVTLTLSAGTTGARTVTVQEEDITVGSYKLTAVKGDTTLTETWADLTDAAITLETGTWSFELQAYSGTDASGELLLRGRLLNKEISAPAELAFTMAPLVTETGTGNVEITITWPDTVPVAAVLSQFAGDGSSGLKEDIDPGTYTYTFTKDGVASSSEGTTFLAYLIDNTDIENAHLLITVFELVHIYDNLTSRKTIALTAADFNSAPAAPSDLTASREAGSTTVNLTWTDNSTNEAGFWIEYSDNGGSTWNGLNDIDGGTTSHADTNVARGTSRLYRIRAENYYGDSDYALSNNGIAVTVPELHTVTYNGNGNTGGSAPAAAEHEEGAEVTVLGNTGSLVTTIPAAGTAEAFTFAGWNTQADGNGISYAPGDEFTMGTENVTLYAVWGAFKTGNTGPAGGYVFYDKGSFSDGWRYLEAAPSDIDVNGTSTFVWSDDYETEVSGTGKAIGKGQANTNLIVAALDALGETNYAAKLCDDWEVTNNGSSYADWFLPSQDELSAMYTKLHEQSLGGFAATSNYWSSTERSASLAYFVLFSNGQANASRNKSTYVNFRVRPARAF